MEGGCFLTNSDGFAFSSVLIENLKSLLDKQVLLSERRICELAEIASEAVSYSKALLENGMNIYEILSLIAENSPKYQEGGAEGILDINALRLYKFSVSLSMLDRAMFAEIYTELLKNTGYNLGESDFLPTKYAEETFVYVKNVYADEAYDVFSQDFASPRVKYAASFKEAVKMVSDGAVSYCLLPLEESGARLASVAELIYHSELKINSVIPVFGSYGDADIKYALVSRHFYLPKRDPDDDRYLEIRLADGISPTLLELLYAADSYGVQVYRVNTLSFDTEDGKRGYYSVVFSGDNVDFTILLVYLTLFASDYTAIGIYKNLES